MNIQVPPEQRRIPLNRFRKIHATREDFARRNVRIPFPDLRGFRFLRPEQAWLQSNWLYLDGIRIGVVGSSGHTIRLNDELNHTLLLPFRGRIAVDRRDHQSVAGPGQFLSVATGERSTTVGEEYTGILVQLPVGHLDRRARLFDPERHPALMSAAGTAPCSTGIAGTLWHHVRSLVEELDRSDAIVASERLSRSAATFLVDLVVEHWADATAPTSSPLQPAAPSERLVRRAEDFMRANVAEPITVTDVAGHAGISVRSLQAGFRRLRGVSPREFLTARRLERARARLLAPDPGDTVTSIIYDCGAGNPGRFAGIYRSAYGETPSETLSASRNR